MISNMLAFRILKTDFILFPSKKLKPSKSFNLNVNGVNVKQVFTLQKGIARIMTFLEPVSPSECLLKSLNLLKFNDIIHSEILSFVYQWFHTLTPSCVLNFFKPIASVHEYSARQSLNENLVIKSV